MSIRNNFNDAISSLIAVTFVNPLVDWLQREKQLQVAPEEILEVLDLPVTTSRTPSVIPSSIGQAQIPPGLRGASNVGTVLGTSTTGGRTKKKEVDPNAPRCTYKFVRGVKKDQLCGEVAAVGSKYCKSCAKKKGVQAQTESTQPVVGPGFGHRAPLKPVTQAKREEPELDVNAIPERPGYFISIGLNRDYILHAMPNGIYVVVGVSEEGGTERSLTMEEKDYVRSIGLGVLDEESETPNSQAQEFPTIQQSSQPAILNRPTFGQVPPQPVTLPSIGTSTAPRLSGGSVPPLGLQGGFRPPVSLTRPGQTIPQLQ